MNSSPSTQTSASKTSQNGSGVPQWLEELKVNKGRWYSSSKARPERLMQISLTSDAQKVHACLELGSMAYQREDAVYTVKDGSPGGKQVWLTPGKIGKLTGISKEHVLRAIKELEYYGLAERFLIDPARGEVKGNVGVKSWALPRPQQEEEKREPRAAPFLELGAEYKALARFISRFKLDLDPDKWGDSRGSYLEAAKAAVAQVEEAEKAAVALLKGFGAQERIYKEERNGNELERNKAGRQASTVVEVEPSLPACPPPVENQNGNATPGITTAEQILELPEVQRLQVETGDTLTPKLAGAIAANLRDAPLEGFDNVIAMRRKKGPIRAGLLPNLATSYADSNDIGKRNVQAKSDVASRQMDEQTKKICRDLWQGYNESERKQALKEHPEMPWPGG